MKYLLRIFVILFCLIFIGFSALLLFHSVKDFYNPNHQINWVKKTATIKNFKKLDYKQEVLYSFNYNHRTFLKSDTINFNPKIAINKKIYVWINPKNPEKNNLKRDIETYNNIIFAIAFSVLPIFIIIGVILSILKENEIVNKIKIVN